jgi:hypothetical protein
MNRKLHFILCFILCYRAHLADEESKPASAVAVMPSSKAVKRYANPDYKPRSANNVLDEIDGLVSQITADVEELRKFAACVEKTSSLPEKGTTTVEYYGGIAHEMHGLYPVGAAYGKDPKVQPEAGKYISEFHYSDGRLMTIVGRSEKNERNVTDRLIYDDRTLRARLSFSDGKFAFGDYAKYIDGKLSLVCRIDAEKNRVLSAEVVFWFADKEDYSVRYALPAGNRSPDEAALTLESIYLPKRATLMFDADGRLKDVIAYSPYQK